MVQEEKIVEVTTVAGDGRTTIPEYVRKLFNLKKKDTVVWIEKSGEIVLRRAK